MYACTKVPSGQQHHANHDMKLKPKTKHTSCECASSGYSNSDRAAEIHRALQAVDATILIQQYILLFIYIFLYRYTPILKNTMLDFPCSDHLSTKSKKKVFRGPGGFVRGLEFVSQAKICARELASAASRCLQGTSGGFQWPPVEDGTDDICFQRFKYLIATKLLMSKCIDH